jgi:site-specific DNA-methyltransferase (adenine-specific)
MATRPSRWQVTKADCLSALPKLAADSVDAVITDPPYGISAKGAVWDKPADLDPTRVPGRRQPQPANPNEAFQAFSRTWSQACLAALKPGGHLVAFAAPRTAHRLTCGLEEAGYEIRDVLMWLQGQGYPATRVLPGGLGTGLKPAFEPIILARKPLDRPLTENLAEHGTGAMNIDACRISLEADEVAIAGPKAGRRLTANPSGRWPANVLLTHRDACTTDGCRPGCPVGALGERCRFFFVGKPSRAERDAGCENLPRRVTQTFKVGERNERLCAENPVANIHPTVKPLDLMRWLVRLLNPPGGLVLDPFTGSGSTGAAAILEGARFHGIEREAVYADIARARIAYWSRRASRPSQPRQRGPRCSTSGRRAASRR